ncbi:MAG: retroviral-like aspartic protease family protein [Sterolibacteriaceae bacterium MAG5]|nr:retroviral-like aspartic protease family protein [Candidatus Nitricoxidireducens bremensis]
MLHSIAVAAGLLAATAAGAADVALAGLLPGRAVVVVNGGNPRTLSVGGKTPEGVKLLAVEDGAALFEIDGKKERLVLGAHAVSSGGAGGGSSVTLTADSRGQFFTLGSVNGAPVRFVVDTGATYVALGASDAVRAGIDYRNKGQPGQAMTANGVIRSWRVPGNSVRLGDITLHEVDVAVQENNMPVVLLGMSFLNRVEMKRAGDTMTLKKRY